MAIALGPFQAGGGVPDMEAGIMRAHCEEGAVFIPHGVFYGLLVAQGMLERTGGGVPQLDDVFITNRETRGIP